VPSAVQAWAYIATAVWVLVGRVKAELTVVKGVRRDDSASESIFVQ